MSIDKTEFIKLNDFDAGEVLDPDALLAENKKTEKAAAPAASSDNDDLLDSLF